MTVELFVFYVLAAITVAAGVMVILQFLVTHPIEAIFVSPRLWGLGLALVRQADQGATTLLDPDDVLTHEYRRPAAAPSRRRHGRG